MKHFGEQANAYREAYDAWYELEKLKPWLPELADVAEAGQRKALERGIALESDVAAEFEAALVPDPKVEALRREVENLRTTKAYPKFITEDAIQAKLDALPEPEPYSDDDIAFAAGYCVVRLLTQVDYTLEQNHTQVSHKVRDTEAPKETADTQPQSRKARTVVELPNGRTLSGRIAELYRLLEASTQESPLTEEVFRSSGVYSAEELENLSHGNFALSTLVSTLRSRLRYHGLDTALVIRSIELDKSHPAERNPRSAYYLENIKPAQAVVETALGKTEAFKHIEGFSLHDAAVLAECINLRAPLLRQMGLQPLDARILSSFDENLPEVIVPPSQQQLDLQRARTYAFIRERLSSDYINQVREELGPEDPRSDFMQYISNLVESKESQVLFERAMRAQIITVMKEQSVRPGGRGVQDINIDYMRYMFDDGTPSIEVPYSYIESGVAAPQPVLETRQPIEEVEIEIAAEPPQRVRRRRLARPAIPASEPEPAVPESLEETVTRVEPEEASAAPEIVKKQSKETRSSEKKEWENDFKERVKLEITKLKYDGLMHEGTTTPAKVHIKSSSASLATSTNIERVRAAGLLPKQQELDLSAADILVLALISTSGQILGKNQPTQRRALELIRECVDNYFEQLKLEN